MTSPNDVIFDIPEVYYIIINLKDHKLGKSRNFRSPRCKKKSKLSNISTKILPSRARMWQN